MENTNLYNNIDTIKNIMGSKSNIITKFFYIGTEEPLEACAVYINGLSDKKVIDKEVLTPLMLHINENLKNKENLIDYLSKRYVVMSNSIIATELNDAVDNMKRGMTLIIIDGVKDILIANTVGGEYRSITEPVNETAVKGAREGFVENIETNISLLRRRIRDPKLSVENFKIGARSQQSVAIMYIDDIANKKVLEELKRRITAINVDGGVSAGIFQQLIEDYTYSVFPQAYSTERCDISASDILEGRIVVLLEGFAVACSYPTTFWQFFQAVEDYNERTIVANFSRMLRLLAAFIVITLPSIYLTLIKYNVELIPIKFVTPIVESRIGIALTPFLEILSMEIVVEFLREGGLRLPTKIAQTLSLVGGIIIGDTAIKSKIVSPTTLLIVGITVVATFLIPNYDMSLCIRILRFPMLFLANMMGILGIAVGWFFILVHLCSLDSLGVPYFEFSRNDLKDSFIRAPIWKMNIRPDATRPGDYVRQTNFRNIFRRNKNE